MDWDRQRKPDNEAEGMFWEKARENEWKPTKRGWPDFWMVKDGRFCVVEVKRAENHSLKTEQNKCMKLLAQFGVPCYRWDPDDGFTRIEDDMG